MRVSEIMTAQPTCCDPNQSLQEAAKLMLTSDCGCIPVIDSSSSRIVGLITDRDITVRAVAAGKDPSRTCVSDAMTPSVVSIPMEASLESCLQLMEENQVRRAPVVDQNGRLVGIVAQADIARTAPKGQVAELVSEVSRGPEIGHMT